MSRNKSQYLWKLSNLDDETNRGLKQLVASFVGIIFGTALRYVREAASELAIMTGPFEP